MPALPCIKDFSLPALRAELGALGWKPFRAEQIGAWLYPRGVCDVAEMTDLSLADRTRLAESFALSALELDRVARSVDGTIKAVLRASDGALIESVLIPEEGRTTLCVSTQVGCPMACSFCATGSLGFTRNLSTGEIIDQVCRMRALLGDDRDITNIVFMGMGEPLLNRAPLSEAIRILIDPKAFAMAPRRLTVSTVGIVPQIDPLLECFPVNLAVSLHATTDAVRDELVPLNRQYPLEVLLGALHASPYVTRRRPIFFEYTLIEGVNDSLEDARRLPRLISGLPSKVNLIPMNSHPGSAYGAPSEERIDAFLRVLAGAGVRVTLRRSRGPDIDAACGQLALRGDAQSAA
jgi:23S rRNA (adenine2503-C2)-methyltransferase